MEKLILLINKLLGKHVGLRQFVKFGIVGVINTVVDYGIFTALIYLAHWHYLIANVFSFAFALTNSYIWNRRWTFRQDGQSGRSEVVKFFLVNIISLGIVELILLLLVDTVHLPKLLAKAIGIGVALFWNFFGTKFWAFRVRG